MTMITAHENDRSEETRVVVKNRENEANQLYRRFREQGSQGVAMLTIAPSDNDQGEEALVGIENGENEANQMYRQFREWRSGGGSGHLDGNASCELPKRGVARGGRNGENEVGHVGIDETRFLTLWTDVP